LGLTAATDPLPAGWLADWLAGLVTDRPAGWMAWLAG